ncbi:hypothetical protein [Micromonospora sp. NPDC051006]|uniref:hypothetical protein n=1 Tax=Micromonospora sp. NPDC051006 TaxID=3364283 RepID=UPI0037B9CC08
MSEAGQPGAATPGEHGDGTGQQDDPNRSGGGWAPQAAGWSGPGEGVSSREAAPRWQPDPAFGWAASSPRHGDLPAPLPGHPGDTEPPARVNGHRTNGVGHVAEQPAGRQTPVSAPPGLPGDDRREPGADRLVVPAQRPAPAVEQPPRLSEPETGPARHSSDEQQLPRPPRWAETGPPTSAPPAVQVPPVGTSASGFEVPPGFHAPTAERSAGDEAAEPRGWGDAYPPGGERRPAQPRAAAEPPAATEPPASEPDWSGPSWNRPSWGAGWAPPWSRQGDEPTRRPGHEGEEPAARRVHEHDEPAGRRAREAEEPAGRRAREEGTPAWAAEPQQPYEPVRAEPGQPYEPVRAETARPYEVTRPEAEPGYAAEADRRTPGERPAWAGGRPAAAPSSAPPEPASAPPAAVERPSWATERPAVRPPSEPLPERPSWASAPPSGTTPSSAPPAPPSSAPPAPPSSAPPAPSSAPPAAVQRPSWAGGPGGVWSAPPDRPSWAGGAGPTDAPPAAVDVPAADDAPDVAELRAARPFRLRPEGGDPAEPPVPPNATLPAAPRDPGAGPRTPSLPGEPPAPTGPARAAATSAAGRNRPSYAPASTSAPPYAARRSAPEPVAAAEPADERRPDPTAAVLPQRVPAEPDVPVVPEPPAVEPPAETPELARIATHLRRDDEPAPPQERPEGFDVNAILGAVREVAGVRDASLRRTPAGAHSLRLDLSDGADPAEVSRQVARLLQERMGLAAAPQDVPGVPPQPPPPVRRRGAEPPAPPQAGERRGEGRVAERRVEGRAVAGSPAGRRTAEAPAVEATPSAGEAPAVVEAGRPPRAEPETPRRRRQPGSPRGRATVEETPGAAAPVGMATGSPATIGASYSGGQLTSTESAPSRPLDTGGVPGPRVVIDHVQVSTFGLDATVEVRLNAADESAAGYATGPAVDGYVLRLCAVAAAAAVDELLRGPGKAEGGRCFVEHAAVVPFGNCEVATVVVLLVCDGWVEQLAGSALVAGDPRQAVVRATLAAVNRRLEALLA